MKRKKVSQEVLDTLLDYSWSGNIRELVNTVHAACANARDGTVLYVHHLPLEIRSFRAKQKLAAKGAPQASGSRNTPARDNGGERPAPPPDFSTDPGTQPLPQPTPASPALEPEDGGAFPSFKRVRRQAVDAMEAGYLLDLIEHTGKDIPQACRVSGLSRARLYELLKKHNVGIVPRT